MAAQADVATKGWLEYIVTAEPEDLAKTAGRAPAHVGAEALTVEIVSTPDALAAMQAEWDGLLSRSEAAGLFLTHEWVSLWWSVYGGGSELHVICVRRADDTLVAIAPLRRTNAVISFIGSGRDVTPEHLDVIVAPGWEEPALRLIVLRLLEDADVKQLDLKSIDSVGTLSLLLRELGAAPGVLEQRPGQSCPLLTLPATVDEFDRSRSANYRKKVREYQRRCERNLKATLRRSTSAASVVRDMATLSRLHGLRWGSESRAFRTDEYVRFHNAFALIAFERGWLRLYALEAGDETLAMLYCYRYGERYYYYQAGRNPNFARERVGMVLMHLVICEAILEGARVFDFLSGEEPYKYRWATSRSTATEISYWKTFAASTMSRWQRRLNRVRRMSRRLLFESTGLFAAGRKVER